MKEVRFFYAPDAPESTELPDEESQHALRVLRLKVGDDLMLMDGRGNFYQAEVSDTNGHRCRFTIRATMLQQPQWTGRIHLAIAPTKMMERMEWLAEKAVEIGIDELSFLLCRFSERRVVKTPRIEKIVVSAAKQSHKAWMPMVNGMTAFSDFVRQPRKGRKYIAHCYDEIPRSYLFDELRKPAVSPDATVLPDAGFQDATVLIGPEGDFSIDEVREAMDCGFLSVHLGDSRLRTETAGLSAVMMIQLSKN